MGRLAFLFLPIVALTVACQAPRRPQQTAEAREEWTRTLPAPDGQLQIFNIQGPVDVIAREGTSIEVRAEKVAHATSEESARDLLTHVNIEVTTTDSGLTIRTERIQGMLIGASFDVAYHVFVPASTSLSVRTEGDITVTGISDRVSLSTAHGSVKASQLSGRIEVRATNGAATVDVAEVGREPIDIRTVRGAISLGLPTTANANISLTSVNGRGDVSGLPFENFEDTARGTRRIRGRINGGGTPIELNAVNGDINVGPRQ